MTTNHPHPEDRDADRNPGIGGDSAQDSTHADPAGHDRPMPYPPATPYGYTGPYESPYGTASYPAYGSPASPWSAAHPAPGSEPQYVPEHPAYAGYAAQVGQQAGYGNGGYAPGTPYAPYGANTYPYGYSYPGYVPPPAAAPPSKRRRALLGAGAAVLALGLVLSGAAIAESQNSGTTSATNPGIGNGSTSGCTTGGSSTGGSTSGGSTSGGSTGGAGVLPGGPGTSQNGQSTSAAVATPTCWVAVVTIVSVLGYQTAESAGTGMILSSDGEILTNNHVINGATSITVTVESTGKSYRADVVGTAPTKDVAVLKLRNASGLSTAKIDETPQVSAGDAVIGVGNAGGTGTLRAASGKVTALEQSITASDETGQNSEKLSGLIQTDAGIISGDSGGPLYDSNGEIIGMDTAASTANSTTQAAYAIPIDDALTVAKQIEGGTETSVIHIGLPSFIGVTVNPNTTGGAGIAAVIPNDPAAKAGITAGSTITAVNGKSVSSSTALKTALNAYDPGQSVSLTWTDANGASHTASTTLTAGPAD